MEAAAVRRLAARQTPPSTPAPKDTQAPEPTPPSETPPATSKTTPAPEATAATVTEATATPETIVTSKTTGVTPEPTPAPEITPASKTTAATSETTPVPAVTSASETTPVSKNTSARSRGPLVFAALAVITLVGGGLAAWFGTEASALTSQPSAQNQALSDPGETSQVTSQVSSAVNALFSYDYAKPGPTQKAQRSLLTGAAVKQYTTMFATVKQNAVKNKLVVTTTVANAGVEMLTSDTARVLIFATESDGSAGAATPTTAEAMLAVNAIRVGSNWKIEGIDTFAS